MGLIGGKSVQLGSPTVDEKTAKLSAEVVSAKGEKLPFVVTMARENGVWRLYSLKSPRDKETGHSENRFSISATGRGNSFQEALNEPIPDQDATRRLVRDALLEFNRAIRARSFTDFYAFVSSAWQAQLTEKQLQKAFQGFIDNHVDISGIADLTPQFDFPPWLTSEGLLMVRGRYATQPFQVYFELKFIYELPSWKLFGIRITSDPDELDKTE